MGSSDAPTTVAAVGDVHLDREAPADAFTHVQSRFDAADVVIGNLEGPLSLAGTVNAANKGFCLRSPPHSVAGLRAAGFDLVSLANNHAMDYGREALVDTLDRLQTHDIAVSGAGRDRAAAARTTTLDRDNCTIGVLSLEATEYTWQSMQATDELAGINLLQISALSPHPHVSDSAFEQVDHVVSQAVDAVDVLIAMLHAGVSIDHTIAVPQRAIAHRLVDAGVDIVVGHHPHTIQGVEVYRGAPILFSLGNFVFDSLPVMRTYPPARLSGMAWFEVGRGGVETCEFYPMIIDERGRPRPLSPEEEAFTRIVELSRREGTRVTRRGDVLEIPLVSG